MAAQAENAPSKAKPERPDEAQFKEDVAAAEKEHAAVMEKLVRRKDPIETQLGESSSIPS